MTLSDAGTVAAIVGTLGTLIALMGRAILNRLAHVDVCLDAAREETRAEAEKVRRELTAQQEKARDELLAGQVRQREALDRHMADEEGRLRHIEKSVAWVTGKMGLAPGELD